jgi:hypothetical protein
MYIKFLLLMEVVKCVRGMKWIAVQWMNVLLHVGYII